MRWLFNLSFRHKIPLWTSFLISFSIFVVGAALMTRAYEDMKSAVVISADNLGHTLANTVAPTLLHDDVWRAFEIVRSPIRGESAQTPVQVDAVVVLGRDHKVFVSSDPDTLPMLSETTTLGADWQHLGEHLIAPNEPKWPLVLEPTGSSYLYIALPVTDKDAKLGHLVLRYAKSVFHPWFIDTIWQGLGLGLLVLAVLIPINWYWGSRMATPLVDLAQRMGQMLKKAPEPLPPDLYPYADELGQLFQAYDRMVLALRDKAALESEMVKSERLAAIGQLTAGIAHEINNPLAGLITVVDTLKLRRDLDPRVLRNLELIDRGLMQIRDTVAALLVQTRVQARPLNPHDLEDIHTLIQPQVAKRQINLEWSATMPTELPAPASLVRQILINLLLNAVQAAAEGGHVNLWLGRKDDSGSCLTIVVRNDGAQLGEEQLAHLFEPFASTRVGGHGLGLWVTYQIVSQLDGRITAKNIDGEVEFVVNLPLGDSTCSTVSA
ncbi:MAG: HAMP domain-containing sensor histidine kinase [Betaproteobacteria bacterium]|nr:HAMP domain-containing sensor histidine kinase [Betaproteobacteria bacterium]